MNIIKTLLASAIGLLITTTSCNAAQKSENNNSNERSWILNNNRKGRPIGLPYSLLLKEVNLAPVSSGLTAKNS